MATLLTIGRGSSGNGSGSPVQQAVQALKDTLGSEDAGQIKTKTEALAQASMKLGEAMYAQAQAGAGGGAGPDSGEAKSETKEDVVDAEFTEVDDDKKNKKSA